MTETMKKLLLQPAAFIFKFFMFFKDGPTDFTIYNFKYILRHKYFVRYVVGVVIYKYDRLKVFVHARNISFVQGLTMSRPTKVFITKGFCLGLKKAF